MIGTENMLMDKTDMAIESHGTSIVPKKVERLKSNFSEMGGRLWKVK